MHPLHVVPKVPLPGKSISGKSTFTSFIRAAVGFVAMAVHSVGLTLVTEKARNRGEPGVGTQLHPAPVGLQVRVDVLAVGVILWLAAGNLHANHA